MPTHHRPYPFRKLIISVHYSIFSMISRISLFTLCLVHFSFDAEYRERQEEPRESVDDQKQRYYHNDSFRKFVYHA